MALRAAWAVSTPIDVAAVLIAAFISAGHLSLSQLAIPIALVLNASPKLLPKLFILLSRLVIAPMSIPNRLDAPLIKLSQPRAFSALVLPNTLATPYRSRNFAFACFTVISPSAIA